MKTALEIKLLNGIILLKVTRGIVIVSLEICGTGFRLKGYC